MQKETGINEQLYSKPFQPFHNWTETKYEINLPTHVNYSRKKTDIKERRRRDEKRRRRNFHHHLKKTRCTKFT